MADQKETLPQADEYDEEPAKAEAPVAPSKEPPPTPRKHPASLVRLALRYGASKENIEQASTGDLAAWIEEQEIVREQAREESVRQANHRQPLRIPPVEPQEDEINWGTDEAGIPFHESDLHPALVRKIKEQHKQLKTLKGAIEETTQRERTRAVASANERLDDAFASLDARYQKLFGSGTFQECSQVEQKRRIAVLSGAGVNANNPPSSKVLVRKLSDAADEIFVTPASQTSTPPQEENQYAAAAKKLSEKSTIPTQPNGRPRITEEQLANGTLGRTTQRTTQEPPSKSKAARAVGAKMKELGLTDADFDSFGETGPDSDEY